MHLSLTLKKTLVCKNFIFKSYNTHTSQEKGNNKNNKPVSLKIVHK